MSTLTQLYANVEKYKKRLIEETEAAQNGPYKYQQLGIMAEPNRARIVSQAYTSGPKRRVDFVYPTDPIQSQEHEEIVLRIQGYAIKVDLPPVVHSSNLPRNIRSLKQHITLTGLGCDQFESCTTAILAIHKVLDSQLPAGTLQEWKPLTEHGHICFDFSNRYFSSSEEADGRPGLPLGSNMDPFGVVANAKPKGIHTEDNQVVYFERRAFNKSGSFKYIPVEPTTIKEGNMLELQVGFAAIPINKGRYLMISKLRSVCIIDREVEHDTNLAVLEGIKESANSRKKTLKRTVGYSDELSGGDSMTELSFKRLRLESDTEHSMDST